MLEHPKKSHKLKTSLWLVQGWSLAFNFDIAKDAMPS